MGHFIPIARALAAPLAAESGLFLAETSTPRRQCAGEADSAPLPNSRTDGRSEAGEGQSKAFDKYFLGNFPKVLKRSHARSRSGQSSRSLLFSLSATETGLIAVANPNFAKRLPKG